MVVVEWNKLFACHDSKLGVKGLHIWSGYKFRLLRFFSFWPCFLFVCVCVLLRRWWESGVLYPCYFVHFSSNESLGIFLLAFIRRSISIETLHLLSSTLILSSTHRSILFVLFLLSDPRLACMWNNTATLACYAVFHAKQFREEIWWWWWWQ
jgi:hypothetical protein